MSSYGRIARGSHLIGKRCPRCGWRFALGDAVEMYGDTTTMIVAHATCPRQPDDGSDRHLPNVRPHIDRLTEGEREDYIEGRW